jgi:AbrB family looped-hinge helix DNA binding protein
MRTTIDSAGRLVIPKHIREELGLTGGSEVELELRDGQVEISPTSAAMHLEGEGRDVYAVPDGPMPKLTQEMVRQTLEQIRR